MGSFMEENSSYPDDKQLFTTEQNFSQILYTNETAKCKTNKTKNNFQTKKKSKTTRWLRFPIYLELKWNKEQPYNKKDEKIFQQNEINTGIHENKTDNCAKKNIKGIKCKSSISVNSEDTFFFDDIDVNWSTSYGNDSLNNLVNIAYDDPDNPGIIRSFTNLYPSLIRQAGGGPKKKDCKKWDATCALNNNPLTIKNPKSDKKSKTCAGFFASKLKGTSLKPQRSDICCSNYIDVAVTNVPDKKKCGSDKCSKCQDRGSADNVSNNYYSECLNKDQSKNKQNCDCEQKFDLISRMNDPAPEPVVVEEPQPSPDAPKRPLTNCEICCEAVAVETFKIKKGDSSPGSLLLCNTCAKKIDKTLLKQKGSTTSKKKPKKTSSKSSSLALCKDNPSEKDVDCRSGKCVKDCGKSRSSGSIKSFKSKSMKSMKAKIKKSASSIKEKKSTVSMKQKKSTGSMKQKKSTGSFQSKPGRVCCPNCRQPGQPDSSTRPVSQPLKSKSQSSGVGGFIAKTKSYCCNYSKNKSTKAKKKDKNMNVCENEKCKKKLKLQKESAEPETLTAPDTFQRSLCECPKGCRCLCSKYSFFEPKLLPIEDKTVTEASPTKADDCEDPEVGQVIEDLKTEMSSLMKKLDKLGKSQCKCSMKKSEVVLYATELVNNPFHPRNKLNRYIQINNDPLIENNHAVYVDNQDYLFKPEKFKNMMFIMPSCEKVDNEFKPFSTTSSNSKYNNHHNEKTSYQLPFNINQTSYTNNNLDSNKGEKTIFHQDSKLDSNKIEKNIFHQDSKLDSNNKIEKTIFHQNSKLYSNNKIGTTIFHQDSKLDSNIKIEKIIFHQELDSNKSEKTVFHQDSKLYSNNKSEKIIFHQESKKSNNVLGKESQIGSNVSKATLCSQHKMQSTNNLRNKIEIISTKVEKDPNTNKPKVLLHLHVKK